MKPEKRGSHYRIIKTVNHVRYSLTFDHRPTKREVDAELTARLHQSPNNGNLRAYLREYAENNANVLSPRTLTDYRSLAEGRRGLEDLLDVKLNGITQPMLQQSLNRYSKTHSPKTCRNIYGMVLRILSIYRPEFAVSLNFPQNPMTYKYVPTKVEITAILELLTDTEWEIPFRLACYGIRQGELLALTLSDLSDQNVLTVNKDSIRDGTGRHRVIKSTPKTQNSNREILIDSELADLIRAKGEICSVTELSLRRKLRRCQDKLGIPHFRWHDLRAYMATELLSQGIDSKSVQAVGGWSDPSFVSRTYQRSRLDREKEKQEKIAEILK